jgi:hypothetical protein
MAALEVLSTERETIALHEAVDETTRTHEPGSLVIVPIDLAIPVTRNRLKIFRRE